ncbi:DUF1858 domain-containing protein [Candidatus Peregrinibacteria bacterium]|nr:DUF1858 domain-containing protein [Candidatus Peregrinibacteria bacterium]
MTIGEILKANPHALTVFEKYGLGCAQCSLNTMETLEQGAEGHGLSAKEIHAIVTDLSAKAD